MSSVTMDELLPLTMPKWGMAMTEGKVVAWLKEPGSKVEVGEEIFEVETEKIVNVIESQGEGVLLRQMAELDDICPVGGLIGVLGPGETSPEAVDEFVKIFQDRFREIQETQERTTAIEPTELTIDDRKIRYLSLGEGGVPVLLIHGLGSDLNGWLFNQTVLAEERRVIAMDLPAHGGSSKILETGTMQELTGGAVGLLDALNIDRVHLVGHSLGGSVAAQLAIQQPDRVCSLTLISSLGPGTAVSESFLEAFIGATRRRNLKASMSQLVANPDLITRDLVENILRVKRIEGVQESWQKIASKAILAPPGEQNILNLSKLDIPVQAIFGAQDQIVPVPGVGEMPNGVALHVIEGAGHIPHMESANRVNILLSEFFAE